MTKEHDLMMSRISDAGLDATDHDPAEVADSIAMETAKRFQELLHSPALREYPADKLVEACRDGLLIVLTANRAQAIASELATQTAELAHANTEVERVHRILKECRSNCEESDRKCGLWYEESQRLQAELTAAKAEAVTLQTSKALWLRRFAFVLKAIGDFGIDWPEWWGDEKEYRAELGASRPGEQTKGGA